MNVIGGEDAAAGAKGLVLLALLGKQAHDKERH